MIITDHPPHDEHSDTFVCLIGLSRDYQLSIINYLSF